MRKLLVLPLLSLAACAGDTIEERGPNAWKTVVDPGTGVALRCFEEGDSNSSGYAITCYRLEEGEFKETVVVLP